MAEDENIQESVPEEDMNRYVTKFRMFIETKYKNDIVKASSQALPLEVDFQLMDKYSPELGDLLRESPEIAFSVFERAVSEIQLEGTVRVRIKNMPDTVLVRDLRSRHLGKFISAEGIVRKASEIRPEIVATFWECPECGNRLEMPIRSGMVSKPFSCDCGNKHGFKQVDKKMIDTRWVVVDEPFELTEGDRPSQVTILLTEDLVSPEGRRMSDPGNRLKITGVLRDVPKGKYYSAKLDFFLDANHVEPTEIGWEKVDITKEDEKRIKELAKDPKIYDIFIDSLAPSLYGLREIKESIVMQLFGGVPRHLRDGTHIRGDIHILIIGDPSAGKCVAGDTKVILNNGLMKPIREIVENKMRSNMKQIDDGFYATGNDDLLSMSLDGKVSDTKANIFWKRSSPETLYIIETHSGKRITVTPTHPFFTCSGGFVVSKKASDIRKGDFIASPRRIRVNGKPQKIDADIMRSRAKNAKHIEIPMSTSPELCRFLAYIIAEGYVQKNITTTLVWFTNSNENILSDFERCAGIFGIPIHKRMSHNGRGSRDFYMSSTELGQLLEKIEPSLLKKSSGKRIPDMVMMSSDTEVRGFLQAFFDSEGNVNKSGIELTSASEELIEQVRTLLLRFGIVSQVHSMYKEATNSPKPKKREYFRLLISGSDVKGFSDNIGFGMPEKRGALSSLKKKISTADIYPNISETLLQTRKGLGLTQFQMGVRRTTYQHFEKGDRNPTEESMKKMVGAVEERLAGIKKIRSEIPDYDFKRLQVVRASLGISQYSLAMMAGLSQSLLSQYETGKCGNAETKPKRKSIAGTEKKIKDSLIGTCDSILENNALGSRIKSMRKLLESDIFWDRIKKIEKTKSNDEWVYDMQVPDVHNFIANHVFVHNSQLLKLVPEIVSRGRYVSGKGVTGAGLTATVTKDEQFMGGWVLEAGALVLANKGMLSIDEFEKMSQEDMVAMHEALEQGSISIAKASIVATLPAKTSVLAGGNPKFSRFDPYMPISKQITLPDTILSRFDLKFAMRDVPHSETDKLVVDHILASRDENYEGVIPKLEKGFIRKYISYARENSKPNLTKEAGKTLRDFYIKTRKRAEGSDSAIPITLRQFEALMRLSEASAKIQLQSEVRKDDTRRAIKLMRFSLKQLGFDPETGQIDVDRAEGASTTSSERGKIKIVMDIINDLSKAKKEVLIEDIRVLAKKEEVEEIDDILDRLKREGMLFEPTPGYVQKV